MQQHECREEDRQFPSGEHIIGGVEIREERHEENYEHQCRTENPSCHHRRDDEGSVRTRRAVHHRRIRRFGGERERREGVHDQIDPEHLNYGKRQFDAEEGAGDGDGQGGHVDRQLEDDETLDVGVERTPPENGVDHARKRIVQQNDCGCLLGDGGAGFSHGDADVGVIERGRVIGAVSGDGDDGAVTFEGADELEFVLGPGAGHDPQFASDGDGFVVIERGVIASGDDFALCKISGIAGQADLTADFACGFRAVAGDDFYLNACAAAARDRVRHFRADGIVDGGEPEIGEILCRFHEVGIFGQFDGFHCQRQSTHAASLAASKLGIELMANRFVERLLRSVGIEAETTAGEDDLRGALDVKDSGIVERRDAGGRHEFSFGGERELALELETEPLPGEIASE